MVWLDGDEDLIQGGVGAKRHVNGQPPTPTATNLKGFMGCITYRQPEVAGTPLIRIGY